MASYHRTMRPTMCPRCGRRSQEWTIERTARDVGIGGCACGEAIPLSFEDELGDETTATPPRGARLTMVPRAPVGWRETTTSDRWTGRVVASAAAGWTVSLIIGLYVLITTVRYLPSPHVGWSVRFLIAGAAVVAIQLLLFRATRSYSFGNGTFVTKGMFETTSVPLEELTRFVVVTELRPVPLKIERADAYLVEVQCAHNVRRRFSLGVATMEEALYIVERLQAQLAESDERHQALGYRGEPLRVASRVEAERALTAADDDDVEDEAERVSDRATSLRAKQEPRAK